MPAMTDPSDNLPTFILAFEEGALPLQAAALSPDFWAMRDEPLPGVLRLTYALITDEVLALVIIINAEPIKGVPCFAIGYAVPEEHRNNGFAKRAVDAALNELQHGFFRSGLKHFFVEAIIGEENTASQKIAATALSASFTTCNDDQSGLPARQYLREFKEG